MNVARLSFVIREPTALAGQYRYRTAYVHNEGGHGYPSAFVPRIGDLIHIPAPSTKMGRVYDVVWLWPAYGSQAWPHTLLPKDGPIVQVFVDEARGPYVDEADEDEDGQ